MEANVQMCCDYTKDAESNSNVCTLFKVNDSYNQSPPNFDKDNMSPVDCVNDSSY